MHLRLWVGFLLVANVFTSVASHAEGTPPPTKVKTLVMPFTVQAGIDAALGEILTDIAVTRLSEAENREVLGQADIAAALDLEAQKQLLGCSDVGCLEELAGAMDVDSLITGSIDKVGEGYLVILTELDTRLVKQVARVSRTSGADEADLLRTVSQLTDELIIETSGKIQLFGEVVIETIPSGALIKIDNRGIGPSPIKTQLPIGAHRIEVVANNAKQIPANFDVSIYRKQTTNAQVKLSVEQTVSEEVTEQYQTDRLVHGLFMGIKGCAGCCLSLSFLNLCYIGVLWVAGWSAISATVGMMLDGTWMASCVVSAIFAGMFSLYGLLFGVGVAGLALMGWGVVDAFSFPEEPLPGVPQHHILVTPPEGSPEVYTLPARETAMAH